MAKTGMRYPRCCKYEIIQNEDGTESEVLDEGQPLKKAISADITINAPEVIQYADDTAAESEQEFISGSISLEINDLEPEDEAFILGKTLTDEGVLLSGRDDTAPYMRWGYIVPHKLNGKRRYQARCFMRVSFAQGNINDATRGESPELRGAPLGGTILTNVDGNWQAQKWEDTVDAALLWLNTMVNIAPEA